MSHDIKLVLTVSGPNPWNDQSALLVSGLLHAIADDAEKRLAPLSASDKPEDWQQVRVSHEVVRTIG